jgi:hypothetical protein
VETESKAGVLSILKTCRGREFELNLALMSPQLYCRHKNNKNKCRLQFSQSLQMVISCLVIGNDNKNIMRITFLKLKFNIKFDKFCINGSQVLGTALNIQLRKNCEIAEIVMSR